MVVQIYLIPSWFYMFDVVSEVAFAVICLLIAALSLKVYKLTRSQEPLFFSSGFLLLGIAYVLQGVFEFLLPSCAVGIRDLLVISFVVIYFIGLLLLNYVFTKTGNLTAGALNLLIILIGFFMTASHLPYFHLISALIFAYIATHCLRSYYHNKHMRTLNTAVGFTMLLIASIFGVLSLQNPIAYVISHVLTGIAFILFLINVWKVSRYEKKA